VVIVINVGIDCGVNTGFAMTQAGELVVVQSMTITQAMAEIRVLLAAGHDLTIYIEDARLRTWFGGADARQARSGAGIREGVGSVKRDCQIWEDWCIEQGVPYKLIHPAQNVTKLTAKAFNQITKWTAKTNEHGRDAAMLIVGRR
jgi:hypothetical protein